MVPVFRATQAYDSRKDRRKLGAKGRPWYNPLTEGVIRFAGTGKAKAQAVVFEAGSGRTTQNQTTWTVHPERYYIGLKSNVSKVEEKKPFEVTSVVVDWNGNLVSEVSEVKYELLALRTRWEWTHDDQTGQERYGRHCVP